MDIPTQLVSNYVRNKGINLKKMSDATGIPYTVIYDSLQNKNRDRDLRVGEFLEICEFLEVDPKTFKKSPATQSESRN